MSRFAVLGAGTAGLASAIALSRAGHAVTVFERHTSLAPVGAGLLIQPVGIRALRELGLSQDFVEASVPVRQLDCRNHRGSRLVALPYNEEVARGISRPAFTDLLLSHCAARDVNVRLATEVTNVRDGMAQAWVHVGPSVEAFDAVVIASGSGSGLAALSGLSAPATPYRWGALNAMFEVDAWEAFDTLQQRCHGPRKLFGLLPTALRGDRFVLSLFWSLPVNQRATWEARALSEWTAEMRALWPEAEPVLEQIQAHDQFSFATYRHAWPKRLASGRVCLVGDAAHAMSPQLGLGSTLAVGDALELARQVSYHGIPAGFTAYDKLRKPIVRKYQVMSRLLTPCFQANLPAWWRDALFGLGSNVPGMHRFMHWSLGS